MQMPPLSDPSRQVLQRHVTLQGHSVYLSSSSERCRAASWLPTCLSSAAFLLPHLSQVLSLASAGEKVERWAAEAT